MTGLKKKVHVLGGGTITHIRAHLALCAPAYGKTARDLSGLCRHRFNEMDVVLHQTKMANSSCDLETNDDVEALIDKLIADNTTKVIFFNVALCDFNGTIDGEESGKYSERLKTAQGDRHIDITPTNKIVSKIRKHRKDIFVVAFKTTCNASEEEQFAAGLNLLKKSSANLVLANDIGTRVNMIITPEEGAYYPKSGDKTDRMGALDELVDIAWHRTHLSFTRSTVVSGESVPWSDDRVYPALRDVIDWCVSQGAYKEFNGVTTGHFAAKLSETEFLTSIRKTNFKDISKNGMVYVRTEGDDQVIAMGARPSVGGQSQRIIFNTFSDTDCIVHFHCPLKDNPKNNIPVMSQREYECGSHQCGQNTVDGLAEFDGIYAVMLNKHGPNIVFNHNIDPEKVKKFISDNFDLTRSTSGFEQVYITR